MVKKIFIASDHAGYEIKEYIIKNILSKLNKTLGIEFEDLGTYDSKRVDYPDYAKKVSLNVLKNKNSFGILICGSGAGMQIAANKIKGIRAVFAYDEYSSIMARKDNNANILTLRARNFQKSKYKSIIELFITTKFSNLYRHKKRILKIKNLEENE